MSEPGARLAPITSGAVTGASEPSPAQESCGLSTGDLEQVVDELHRLDRNQLKRLVGELRHALLDAVSAIDPETGEVAKASFADAVQSSGQEQQAIATIASAFAPTPVVPADAIAGGLNKPDREGASRPRRVGLVLASGFLATIAASLLFVPAAGPPLEVGAIRSQTVHVEPATTPGSARSIDVGDAASVVPHAAEASVAVGESAPNVNGPVAQERADTDRRAAADAPPVAAAGGEQRTASKTIAAVEPSAGTAQKPEVNIAVSPTPSAGDHDRTQIATVPPPAPAIEPDNQALPPVLLQPDVIAPASQTPTPNASASTASPSLSPEVVKALIKRGDHLLALGDIASARMFYERAAETGNAAAATGVARTFDPLFLKQMGVVGIRGDRGKALYWYRRASRNGDPAAEERLSSLLSESSGSISALHH